MITSIGYFQHSLDKANEILFNEKNNISLVKVPKNLNFSPKFIHDRLEQLYQSFPYEIIPASKKFEISLFVKELDYLYYECESTDKSISSSLINEVENSRKNTEIDEESDKCIIYDILGSYFHSLIFCYDKFLTNARNYYFFSGINSEEKILKNLLILYRGTLQSKTTQINFIYGVKLTKELSDHLLKMLIDYIEQRLLMLNPDEILINGSFKINHIKTFIQPLKWLGSQQELLELFIELINNEWIEEVEHRKRKKFINSILQLFDIELTKKNLNSDSENALYQKFKGEIDNGKRIFPFLDKKSYQRRFNEIKRNDRVNY